MASSTERTISLGVRLISIIVVVVTLILSVIGSIQYSRTKTLYTQLVDDGLNAACVRMTGNLGSPLWNFSKEQTAEVLKAEMAQETVRAIAVHMGTEAKVFAGTAKTSAGGVEPIEDESTLPRHLLRRSFEVPWEGNTIATGTLYYSLDSLEHTLRAQVASTIVQAVITDLFLIVLIGLVLSSIVVRPLGSLTGVAKRVASGNFSGSCVEKAIEELNGIASKRRRDELGELTNTFSRMLVNLKARDEELDNHRRNLENLVAERTSALTKRNEEMRLVLDNVEEGLVLVTPEGKMAKERSAAFTRFFGDVEGSIEACLFEEPRARAFFRLGFEQIIEGFMPLEVVLDQLPKSSRRGSLTFGLRYQALVKEDVCRGVLFMINDITAELAAQKRDREQYEQIRVFERCMRDRSGFIEFLTETRGLVDALRLERFGTPEERLRVIHTIKGNTALFDVLSVADAAHLLETALIDHEVESAASQREALLDAWDGFLQRVTLLLGERLSDHVELSRADLQKIIAELRSGQPTSEIVRQLVTMTYEPMKLRFGRIEEQLRSLANRLHKAPVECITEGDKLRLPPDLLTPFWAVFPHVVRNVADHGFERAEERKMRGKSACNRVRLSAKSDDHSIEITIADDGHGIAWDAVAEKARRLGMPCSTRQELISALFSPGFSMKDQVSATSGRGIGLSAIAVAVSELKGSFRLESEPGKGTVLTFTFPCTEQPNLRPSLIPLCLNPVSTPPPRG